MAMKLLTTKHLGGTTFGLSFVIEDIGNGNPKDGQIFDIQGLVLMRFFVRNTSNNRSEVLLSLIKHQLTMISSVKMTVRCSQPEFPFKCSFNCPAKWSPPKTLIDTFYSQNVKLTLEVNIDIGFRKLVLDAMYVDEDFTDFHLSTAEGSVAVHKACLASHSDVFRRMLCGEWKETTEGRIQLEGVSLQTLKDLKRYMYLGTFPTIGLQPLLLIAMYYMIDELLVKCIVQLAHSVNSENLFDLLEFSFENHIQDLAFAILKTVRAQPSDMIMDAHAKIMKRKLNNVNVEKTEVIE